MLKLKAYKMDHFNGVYFILNTTNLWNNVGKSSSSFYDQIGPTKRDGASQGNLLIIGQENKSAIGPINQK